MTDPYIKDKHCKAEDSHNCSNFYLFVIRACTFSHLQVFPETADLVTFTGEIFNRKPHFLCSANTYHDVTTFEVDRV